MGPNGPVQKNIRAAKNNHQQHKTGVLIGFLIIAAGMKGLKK